MPEKAPRLRTLLVPVLALALTFSLVTILPGEGEAQLTDDCEMDRPLFIERVHIQGVSLDEDSHILQPPNGDQESAVFLNDGDRIQFRLDIVDRRPSTCSDLGFSDTEFDLDGLYLITDGETRDISASAALSSGQGGTCNGGSLAPGEDCTTRWFDNPMIDGDHEGEQRVRFLLTNGDDEGLAGAERVLVVGQLPNMEPTGFTWLTPGDEDRHTTYGEELTTFEVTVENNGDYENWNPNGGEAYADRTSYWYAHVTEEGEAGDVSREEDAGDVDFECDGEGPSGWDEAVCSYRRGAILETPIYWEISPEDEPGNVVQSGVHELTSFGTMDLDDRDDAIGPLGVASLEETFEAFDLRHLAGTYDLTLRLDHDPNSDRQVWIPDSDPDANIFTDDEDIDGVDLVLTEIGISIDGFDGLCTDTQNLCDPTVNHIRLHPAFENAGEHGPVDRWWNASVNLKVADEDEQVARAPSTPPGTGDLHRVEHDGVEDPDEEVNVFENAITVEPSPTGGKHVLMIRLDHPEHSYGPQQEGSVNEAFGRIMETHEANDCPVGWDDDTTWTTDASLDNSLAPNVDDASNTWCIELFYDAPEGPSITDPHIILDGEEQDPLTEEVTLFEGVEAPFRAHVEPPAGTENVTAHFIHPQDDEGNQNVTNTSMQSVEGENNLWEVENAFIDHLGQYHFQVEAEDALGNVTLSEPAPFTVSEWPKNISTSFDSSTDTVNGQTFSLADPPEYQGTVSEPDNSFNLTVNITDTGHEPQPGDVHFRVWDPDGNEAIQKARMIPITYCEDQDGGYQTGEDCTEDDGFLPGDDVGEPWTAWYADTTEDAYQNHPNISLPWVGEFNVEVIVKDAFDRTNHANWTIKIDDQGPAELWNETLTPTTLAPGDEIFGTGEASDPLRVERVLLNVTKPSGETAEGDLSITQVHDAETQSGTWEGTFAAGEPGGLFDQAGTYEVTMIADDFGINPNSTLMDTVTVEPGDPPEILSLFTDPSEQAEAGMNLTWSADIVSTTAIQPPELTVTKEDGSTETLILTQDEDTDLWTVTIQPDPLQPEETWTYELEVRDFADQIATETGEILVLQNTPPHATNWQPNVQTDDGRYWVNATPTISVDLVDANGVNETSIHVRIDGSTIWEDGAGDAQVQEIPRTCPGCYQITYTPTEDLEDGDTLTLEVKATEESDEELESEWQTRQYHVDATPPSADLNMAPSLTVDGATVIGLVTEIDARVEDAQSGPGDLRITVESLAGTTAATREVVTVEEERSFQLNEFESAFRGHGEYRIELEPWDAVGNKGDTQQARILYDAAPPQISIEPQLDRPASFLAVNVTDISEVMEVSVHFTPDDQPEQAIELERDGHLWVGEIINPETGDPYPEGTEIQYHIEAQDYWGNTGSTDTRTFIAGATPPTITIDAPQEGDTIQGTIDVLWTATDEDVPDEELNVSLWYSLPDGDPREITGATDLDNTGQFTLDTTQLPNGQIELQAIAFDGSTFGSDTVTVTIRNLGDAFEGPELLDADIRDDRAHIQPGQESTFQVRITQNVMQAWANVTKDGQTIASYDLQDQGDGIWSAVLIAPEEEGDYDVDLAAMTAEGPIHADSAFGFSVQSDDKSFLPEWTILTVLFAGAVAVGAFGLSRRWG